MIENEYILDGWRIETASGRISRHGVTRHLEPQVMKVLSYLASRPDSVVSREELFSNLWRHSFVSDAALTRCIFEIRRAFGDDPQRPRIVETIPRVGFRLLATATLPRAEKTRRSRTAFIATAATVVMSVFLLQAGSDQHQNLASRTYDQALAQFSDRTEASNKNAITLFEKAIELDPRHGLAYAGLANALSLQVLFWNGDRIADARLAADIAMQIAPEQPQSYNARGLVRQLVGDYPTALTTFEKARQLDPDNVDSMIYTADIYRRQLEFRKATDMYLQVVRRVPDHPFAVGQLAFLNLRMGDLDNASKWIRRAIDDDPDGPDANLQFAALQMVTGNLATAIDICEQVYRLYPDHRGCLQILGRSNIALGRHDEAMRWFQLTIDTFPVADYALLGEAQVLIANNRRSEGLAIVEEVLRSATAAASSPSASWWNYWAIAACHSLKGDVDGAFVWLEKSVSAGRRFYLWDATDSVFSTLRGDQRFERIISMTRSLSNAAS
jgi:DNA-binding winged helix-turn-helix (wHTH) protein/TolA-binding protein